MLIKWVHSDHGCTRLYSVGPLKIDFKLLGNSDSADLHSGSFKNVKMTVTIFKIKLITLMMIVNVHTPLYLFLYEAHVAPQYIIQIKSVNNEKAIKYHSLCFWGGS